MTTSGGKGYGGGEVKRDPLPTEYDSFADYLARRKAEEAEAAAPLAPVAAVPADPTVREGLARMLRPRRRTQTLRSWFSHRDVPSLQSVCSETVEVLTTTNIPKQPG